jgi:hypothetical protein
MSAAAKTYILGPYAATAEPDPICDISAQFFLRCTAAFFSDQVAHLFSELGVPTVGGATHGARKLIGGRIAERLGLARCFLGILESPAHPRLLFLSHKRRSFQDQLRRVATNSSAPLPVKAISAASITPNIRKLLPFQRVPAQACLLRCGTSPSCLSSTPQLKRE